MRVIFTGTTGVNMKQIISNLTLYCYAQKGLPKDLEDPESTKFLKTYFLEDEIKKKADFAAYLDSDAYKWQEDVWEDAFNRILAQVDRDKPKHVFLCMNAPYFRNSRFFPAPSIDPFKKFDPDIMITLIEEAHLVWNRIRKREKVRPMGSEFRLREIFAWRTASILLADTIAKALTSLNPHKPEIRNYVIPVKHPPQMFYRLIFKPDILTVYSSFPITHTRFDEEARKQIDNFRYRLHERFCVFDPITIDETIYEIALNENPDSKEIELKKEHRWPMKEGFALCGDDDDDYPMLISSDQLREVVTEVENNTRHRDYRMISQVKALAAFRPYYGGRLSRGVNAEVLYANNVAHIRCFICWPKEDAMPGGTPFEGIGIIRENVDEILEDLEKVEGELKGIKL